MNISRTVVAAGLAFLLLGPALAVADQPRLGFSGTLVMLRGEYEGFGGYRVNSVRWGTPAARMGLERGDIVVFIGPTMGFTTHEAYMYALRQQGATATIGIINVRTGRLVWDRCRLNHDPRPHEMEPMPRGLIMVDFRRNMR